MSEGVTKKNLLPQMGGAGLTSQKGGEPPSAVFCNKLSYVLYRVIRILSIYGEEKSPHGVDIPAGT